MRILLCSLGSHGVSHPYLALGRELMRHGHEITFATSAHYQALVERHRIAFAPIRPEAPVDDHGAMARIMDAWHGPEAVIKGFIMPALRDTYEDRLRPASQADLLISHVLTYAVPVLAEKLGKPWASTVLSPMVFFSAHDVPVPALLPMLAKLGVLGPGFNAWLIRQLKRVSHSWSRPVAELRRELGFPPGRDPLWEGQYSPHLAPAMFSPRFGLPQPDWPPNVQVTGFPFLDAAWEVRHSAVSSPQANETNCMTDRFGSQADRNRVTVHPGCATPSALARIFHTACASVRLAPGDSSRTPRGDCPGTTTGH